MNEVEPKSSSELLEDKSYTDPYEYYQSFLESRSFKEAFEKRRKDLEADGIDASDEKVMEGFFMTNKYKDLLWDYYEGGAIIKYEPGKYNNEINEALRRYWEFIKNSREAFENVPKQAVIGDKIVKVTSKVRRWKIIVE
jgi:hypothetical protein